MLEQEKRQFQGWILLTNKYLNTSIVYTYFCTSIYIYYLMLYIIYAYIIYIYNVTLIMELFKHMKVEKKLPRPRVAHYPALTITSILLSLYYLFCNPKCVS